MPYTTLSCPKFPVIMPSNWSVWPKKKMIFQGKKIVHDVSEIHVTAWLFFQVYGWIRAYTCSYYYPLLLLRWHGDLFIVLIISHFNIHYLTMIYNYCLFWSQHDYLATQEVQKAYLPSRRWGEYCTSRVAKLSYWLKNSKKFFFYTIQPRINTKISNWVFWS